LVLGLSVVVGPMGVAGENCASDNGDVNGDAVVDISDAVYLLGWLFLGGPAPAPLCDTAGVGADCAADNGDTNGDTELDISDVLYLLIWHFLGGPEPLPICAPPGPQPLGPESVIFYGSTEDQNAFNYFSGLEAGTGGGGVAVEVLNVRTVFVDTNDHRSIATEAQKILYRNTKSTDFCDFGPYWLEASFGKVDVAVEMKPEVLNMSGAFDDYYHRSFVAASLRSNGLNGVTFPITLHGIGQVTLHIRDSQGNDDEVTVAPAAGSYTLNDLQMEFQTALDGVRLDWATCTISGGELVIALENFYVEEGSFVRVESGIALNVLGFSGPEEIPGDPDNDVLASLTGKLVPGGFPVTTMGVEWVEIEIRDESLVTRRFTVNFPAANLSKADVEAAIVPALNTEFDWAEEFNAGADRLAFRLKLAASGEQAAIRVVGGSGLSLFGLDGPERVDGVVTEARQRTVRGGASPLVAEALSLYIRERAMESGIDISQANETALNALVKNDELICDEPLQVRDDFSCVDSFQIIFVEQHLMTPLPTPKRRAVAWASGYFDLAIEGNDGYVYEKQVKAGFMIGPGNSSFETWVHELGHNLSFLDIYKKPGYDSQFDSAFDYCREWAMMNTHSGGAHVGAWHKTQFGREWVDPGLIKDVDTPDGSPLIETSKFTLIPLEYPAADYPALAVGDYTLAQVVRIKLSAEHWILVSNRQPGPMYSQKLPGNPGVYPVPVQPRDGGVFVTDTVSPNTEPLYRSYVTALGPHGTSPGSNRVSSLSVGDSLDLSTTFPAYDGTTVSVVSAIPGPGGRPDALQIEVEREMGDFIELGIRAWEAPGTFGTHDIWIDWTGDGPEDYIGEDPPLDNGQDMHWHEDGLLDDNHTNLIKVRVRNEGTVTATDVQVRVKRSTPMGLGSTGNYVQVGDSSPQDIPAKGYRNFEVPWVPTEKGHTCILAEILTYTGPFGDLDLTNNSAKENIDQFYPTAGSPYAPLDIPLQIHNDFSVPIDVMLIPMRLPDGIDLELERAYFPLAPGEDIEIQARVFVDENKIPPDNETLQRFLVGLHSFYATEDAFLPFGGISMDIRPRNGSEIVFTEVVDSQPERLDVRGELIGRTPQAQTIDAVLVDASGRVSQGTARTGSDGRFAIPIGDPAPGPAKLTLYYFGDKMSPSDLTVAVEVR